MSRAHELAYRLLSESVRLEASARRALYVTLAALIGSGIGWLAVHYAESIFAGNVDEMHRLSQEALALKVHGAAGFATLFVLGAMSVCHVRLAWALKRNRAAGTMVLAMFTLLIVTGYALYYLVNDETHAIVSLLHWTLGMMLAPMLIVHIIAGRRGRRSALAKRFSALAEP